MGSPEKSPKKPILNRRNLLIGGGALATAGVLKALPGSLLWMKAWEGLAPWELKRERENLVSFLRQRYGINLAVDFSTSTLTFGGTLAEEIGSQYLKLEGVKSLRRHLALYPPELIRSLIREIVIANRIKQPEIASAEPTDVAGVTINGSSMDGTIIVKVRSNDPYNIVFTDNINTKHIHHEIGHRITKDVNPGQWALRTGQDPQEYSPLLWSLYADKPEMFAEFAYVYGMKNADDDMATVAEMFYGDPKNLRARAEKNETLKRKVLLMRLIYSVISGGKMNDQYWRDLEDGKVNEEYWER